MTIVALDKKSWWIKNYLPELVNILIDIVGKSTAKQRNTQLRDSFIDFLGIL